MGDYAEELTEQTTQTPETLTYYIDYEKMGRDMEMSGDVFTIWKWGHGNGVGNGVRSLKLLFCFSY